MDELEKGKFGFFFFFLFIIALVVGGYYLINHKFKDEKTTAVEEKVISDALKIDKSKTFVYKEVDSVLNEDIPIIYEYPIINLNTEEIRGINATLKSEISTIKNNVKLQNQVQIDPNEEILYNEGNIYSASIRDYEIYDNVEYSSLVILDYSYYCTGKSGPKDIKAYTFNVETGAMLNKEQLLEKYRKTNEDINEAIKSHLAKELTKIIETDATKVNFIEITNTIESLEYNKTIVYYINQEGKLALNFVVKTEGFDYNDIIVFD